MSRKETSLLSLLLLIILIIPVTVFVLKGGVFETRKKASGTAVLQLNPITGNILTGQETSIDIEVSSGASEVSSAVLAMTYEKDKIEVVSLTPTNKFDQFKLSMLIGNDTGFDNATGQIKIMYSGGSVGTTGVAKVATLIVKPLSGVTSGTTVISFDNTAADIAQKGGGSIFNGNGIGGTYTISATNITPTVPPGTPVLNFKFKMERGEENNNKAPARNEDRTQKITIKVGGAVGLPVVYSDITAVSNDQGVWKGSVNLVGLEKLQPVGYYDANGNEVTSGGTPRYHIYIKGPKHLAKKYGYRGISSGANLLDVSQKRTDYVLPGDVPDPNKNMKQDGVANGVDFNLIEQQIQKTDNQALAIGDLNYDGVVNGRDSKLCGDTIQTVREDEP